MRKLIGFSALILSISACNQERGPVAIKSSDLKNEKEKVSYILGYSAGRSFVEQDIQVDRNIYVNAFKQGIDKSWKSALTDKEIREIMTAFRASLMEKRKKELDETSRKNRKEAEDFFAKNKEKPGVVTLPSGLQYKIIQEGKGKKANSEDTVKVEYLGTFLDGKPFDGTGESGKPATFTISTTIPGIAEALKLMSVGSEWELYLPSQLAYGERGAGPFVGPSKALKFNIKLLAIKKSTTSEGEDSK